jgi:hypothetical protein
MNSLARWTFVVCVSLLSLISLSTVGTAQGVKPTPTPDPLKNLQFRQIGPFRGGRVGAVTGVASDPKTFYYGATGGGVWKSTNSGVDWVNVSDGFFKTTTIGAIAVADSDPNIIYVGTGEETLRGNV